MSRPTADDQPEQKRAQESTRPQSSGLPASAPPASSTKESVDELLRRLEASARALPPDDSTELTQITSEASEHVSALQATLSAQQQAQEMLAEATKVRGVASKQAENILLEAQDAAERLTEEARRHADRARQETADWAAGQRATIDDVVARLVESATRDADEIREDALSSAMAEAEKTARQYVARAAARGARDAEAIRAQARDVLSRSTSLVADANASMQGLAGTMSTFVGAMKDQMQTMEQLLEEARSRVDASVGSPVPPEDEVDAPDPAAGPQHDLDESADKAEQSETVIDSVKESDEKPAETGPAGRPLGSLFRGPDKR